jgi:protein-L-isoaspartate(D-aspartate) O-methyltransferase
MEGWIIPSPRAPTRGKAQFAEERAAKVRWLRGKGLLRSERIAAALLAVPREDFIPPEYRDYAYQEVPLPLPGREATVSCPHSYPLFYEPLGLDEGHRFMEIGTGSGYGAAVAREVVGPDGLVVSVEIDPATFEFAKGNLERAGCRDVVLVHADGGLGHPELAPYDRIAVTAACAEIPPPLVEQLVLGGRAIGPVFRDGGQELVLWERTTDGVRSEDICRVAYVSLRGSYGALEP